MKRTLLPALAVACFLIFQFSAGNAAEQKVQAGEVRSPVLAGTWYPGNPEVLRQAVAGYLSKAEASSAEGKAVTMIVPHAGYVYSGQVAAYSYKLVQRRSPGTVVLIGPSHRVAFRGFSVSRYSGYKTPLGVAPVDQDLAGRLLSMNPQMKWVAQADAQEHSLEIQIPFLQGVLKEFRIVPILMGDQDLETCTVLAQSLIRSLMTMEDAVILASTDLSHYHTDQQARTLDGEFIRHVRDFAPEALAKAVVSGSCEACGAGPAVAAMLAARELGANRSVILNYANSGDVTGDRRQVVGYLSAALVKAP
ncbi:MAG: AmmeMemoRadiSam system protein B [Deltaproteobacteria bacterium]